MKGCHVQLCPFLEALQRSFMCTDPPGKHWDQQRQRGEKGKHGGVWGRAAAAPCQPWAGGGSAARGCTVGTGWMCCPWVQDGCAAHGCRVGAPWPSSPPQLQPQLSAALCSGQSSAGLPHSSRALLWGRAAHESASLMRGHNRQKHTRAFLTEKHAELLWSAALRAKPGGSEGGAAAGQPRPLLPSSPPPRALFSTDMERSAPC